MTDGTGYQQYTCSFLRKHGYKKKAMKEFSRFVQSISIKSVKIQSYVPGGLSVRAFHIWALNDFESFQIIWLYQGIKTSKKKWKQLH